MSSTESPTFTSLPPDSDDNGGMARGANYFFGFLITFIVLLVLFVACGVGSRRRFVARRDAAMMAQLEPWAPDEPGGLFKEPTIHETWLVVEKEKGWGDIQVSAPRFQMFRIAERFSLQPLNLQVVRASDLLPEDFHSDHRSDYRVVPGARGSSAHEPPPESSPQRQSFLTRLASLPRAILPSFCRSSNKSSATASDEENVDLSNDPIQGVQVVVFVNFPSAMSPRSSRHSTGSLDGDYALGVRTMDWDPGFSALTHDRSPRSI